MHQFLSWMIEIVYAERVIIEKLFKILANRLNLKVDLDWTGTKRIYFGRYEIIAHLGEHELANWVKRYAI